MTNLPVKGGNPVTGAYHAEHDMVQICAGGWDVASVHSVTNDLGAMQIARLLEEARDVGYAQAQTDIRESLGIKV